jgi:hypothetical protein
VVSRVAADESWFRISLVFVNSKALRAVLTFEKPHCSDPFKFTKVKTRDGLRADAMQV